MAKRLQDVTNADPPRDFDALREMLIARGSALPKRLSQVAAYSLDNPEEMAFGTTASIAGSAGVQPSTLVRFAQHLGYEGFSDLQTIFRERLRERNASYEDRLDALKRGIHSQSQDDEILQGFLSAGIRSIETLSASLDPAAFERFITVLARAETIYLIAKRRSFPIAAYVAYAFSKMHIRHVLVSSPNGIDDELIAMATPGDAAFAVSFSPYAGESIAQARKVNAAGVPLVAITDSAFSPLVQYTTEWIEIAEADFAGFRSLSATMALAMAITVGIAERRR